MPRRAHGDPPFKESLDLAIYMAETAPAAAREALQHSLDNFQFVPNLHAVMAEASPLPKACKTLDDLDAETSLSVLDRQLVLLSLNDDHECQSCMAAHSMLATMEQMPEDVHEALRTGAPLQDPKLEAWRRFPTQMADKRDGVTGVEVETFKAHGYTDANVLEIVLAVGFKVPSKDTNHFAQTPVDAAFAKFEWNSGRKQAAVYAVRCPGLVAGLRRRSSASHPRQRRMPRAAPRGPGEARARLGNGRRRCRLDPSADRLRNHRRPDTRHRGEDRRPALPRPPGRRRTGGRKVSCCTATILLQCSKAGRRNRVVKRRKALPMQPVTLPKLDVDAVVAMQKANMDTLVKAQTVLLDAAQAAVKAQYGFVAEYVDQMQAMLTGKFDAEKKADAYVADVKAAADKYVTVTQNQVDLGMKAQAEAMDMIAKRVQKNVDELQHLAA